MSGSGAHSEASREPSRIAIVLPPPLCPISPSSTARAKNFPGYAEFRSYETFLIRENRAIRRALALRQSQDVASDPLRRRPHFYFLALPHPPSEFLRQPPHD